MKAYRIMIESIDDDGTSISSVSTVIPASQNQNDDAMQVAKSLGRLLRGFSELDHSDLLESCEEDMLLLAAAVYAYGWRAWRDNVKCDYPDAIAFDAAIAALNANLPASMRSYDGKMFKP